MHICRETKASQIYYLLSPDAMPFEGDAQVRRLNPHIADSLTGRRFQYVK